MILLDTCALLWLDSDRNKFSSKTLKILNRNADALSVSPISFLEIGIKFQKGKLTLQINFEEWTEEIIKQYSLTVIPVSKDIAVYASGLPKIHKDPFDRLIIATAIINKMKIVTADRIMQNYPDINVVW